MFKFLKYLRSCMLIFVLCIFTTCIQCLIELSIPLVMANIVDLGILSNNFTLVLKNSLYMILLAITSIIFSFLSSYFYTITSHHTGFILREKTFKYISMFSISDYNEYGVTALMNRVINDTIQIQQLIFKILCVVVPSLIYFVCGFTIIIYINIQIFIYLLFLIPIMIILFIMISNYSSSLFKNIQKLLDKVGLLVREKILGIKVIRAFCNENYHFKKFNYINLELTSSIIKSNCLVSILIPIISIFVNISIVFIFWICSFLISFNQIKMGVLLALIQYVSISLYSILSILDLIKIWPKASISINRLEQIQKIGFKKKESMDYQLDDLKNYKS